MPDRTDIPADKNPNLDAGMGTESEPVAAAPVLPGLSDQPAEGETVSISRSSAATKKKVGKPAVIIVVAVGLIMLFMMIFHRPAQKLPANQAGLIQKKQKAPVQAAAPGAQQAPNSLPTDSQVVQDEQVNKQNTTAEEVERTRKDYANAQGSGTQAAGAGAGGSGGTGNSSLAGIGTFTPPSIGPDGNPNWAPQAYSGNGYSGGGGGRNYGQEAALRLNEVTKPSLTFIGAARQSIAASGQAAAQTAESEPVITNFGYEPGFHLAARLEMVATTATAAPVIAIVEYDYRRDGVLVIPAGSRAIGTMNAASSTGLVGIQFNSIRLPDGTTEPISAIGLNRLMGPLKGVVTGRNRSKEFLAAAVGGLGESLAMFANSNSSGSLSEADMIRMNAAQNIGTQADSQVNQLLVNEHIIVSVPAGTELEVTFVGQSKPAVKAAAETKP